MNSPILNSVPINIRATDVLTLIKNKSINFLYINLLKDLTTFSDDIISGWLNINVKTYRSYKKKNSTIKVDIQEHTVLLVALIKHGIEVFGSKDNFSNWLGEVNFHFDQKKPIEYLNTISGIKFVDDRLAGIEYGDNA